MALPTVSSRTLRLCLYGCLVFGSLALADDVLDTSLWPDGVEYRVTFRALAGVYYQLHPDRERIER
jgi:hypothetical protein